MQCKCGHTYTVASYCNNTDCTVLCKCPSPVLSPLENVMALLPFVTLSTSMSILMCTECRIVSIYHLAYARSAVLRFRDDVGARGCVVPMRRSVQRGHAPGSIITPRVVYSPCPTLRRCMHPLVCASGRPTLFVGSVHADVGSSSRFPPNAGCVCESACWLGRNRHLSWGGLAISWRQALQI